MRQIVKSFLAAKERKDHKEVRNNLWPSSRCNMSRGRISARIWVAAKEHKDRKECGGFCLDFFAIFAFLCGKKSLCGFEFRFNREPVDAASIQLADAKILVIA